MNLDGLLSPVSEQSPCGPDLDEVGDNDYFNYTISAESRFPQRFYDPGKGQFFDRKTIKLDEERKQISALLARSRDLRLLVLMAQFEAVMGDVRGFSATLNAVSELLGAFWSDVHPQSLDGDMELRRVALEGLDERSKVAVPLGYAALFSDRRAGAVSLRAWQVANKPEIAYKDEEKPDVTVVRDAFSAPENREAVDAAFAAVIAAGRSIKDIRGRFLAEGLFEYAPSFDNLQAVLSEISALFTGNAAHLAAQEEDSQGKDEPHPADTQTAGAAAPPAVTPKPGMRVTLQSHREAKAALVALETYFAENEPSSPALILVHQARLLIGRPLVDALAALAPGRAAILNIDQASGFFLDMDKMKQLTIAIPTEENGGGGLLRRLTAQDPVVRDRDQAVAAMLGVEAFLAEREPSSPVSMLLARARALMGSNFLFLLKELLPEEKKS